MTTTTAPESQPFQAEVAELLNLMVHSVYSETDIFLRELISNASDACDKLRYEAISAPELITDGAPPKIRIAPNKTANTLSVVDSGIGMDRQELIDNLGTIARSGTKSFLSRLTEAKDGTNLIGQFGVGFYAAFMVADRIVVTSRRAGSDEVFVWSSSGVRSDLDRCHSALAELIWRGSPSSATSRIGNWMLSDQARTMRSISCASRYFCASFFRCSTISVPWATRLASSSLACAISNPLPPEDDQVHT